ncbi:MAG: hypothetical protein HFACDABA_02085 [Anaerolineales bacterium]|nr:hypothetical protein [Anaerolineales bacterium]
MCRGFPDVFRRRFPPWTEIVSVFSFVSLLVYGRMFFVFAQKLPSWLMYLSLGRIASILSYALAGALFESLGYALLLALACALLPARWFRNEFIARSLWGFTTWMASLNLFFNRLSANGLESGLQELDLLPAWLAVTTLLVLAAFVFARAGLLKRVALWFADRSLVFLYIFLPASLLGLLAVAVRNIV